MCLGCFRRISVFDDQLMCLWNFISVTELARENCDATYFIGLILSSEMARVLSWAATPSSGGQKQAHFLQIHWTRIYFLALWR